MIEFTRLPLGARFRHQGLKEVWVIIDKTGCGLCVLETKDEDPMDILPICSVAESEDELKQLKVIRV